MPDLFPRRNVTKDVRRRQSPTHKIGDTQTPTPVWTMWLMAILLSLILIGYGVAGALSQVLQVPSTETSYPFRGLVFGLSVLVLCLAAFGQFRLPIPVAVFLILYLFRLLWDNQFTRLPDSQKDLIFFVVVVLVPTLSAGIIYAYFDERRSALAMGLLGSFACLLIVFGITTDNIVTGAIDATVRASFESLNAITIGYVGAYTLVSGVLVFWLFRSPIALIIGVAMAAAGLMTLVAGGSRGPLVSIALFLLLYAISQRSRIFVFIMAFVAGYVLFITEGADIAIFKRFANLANDPSVWERLYVQRLSIDAGLNNPLLGNAYLELTTLSYPHNLLIESWMALGIVGLTLMAILQIRMTIDTITLMRAGQIFVPFIAVFALTNAQLSGSLFESADFYIASVLTWLIAKKIRQEKDSPAPERVGRRPTISPSGRPVPL